jgi:beta-lactamase superfamily II metal-dependent hydrolase
MISISSDPAPDQNQFEITLLGTGGGYGECLVIHLGHGNWAIVDSCKNPTTGEVLPLAYLNQIGIGLNSVKLIVCTHWHDDHILGISEVVRQCEEAKFCFARANDLEKFLLLINMDYKKAKKQGSLSSTIEFMECLKLMKSRIPIGACQDRMIDRYESDDGLVSEIITLSPSDKTIQNFDTEISQLITEFGSPSKKIIVESPNDKSVVLFLRLGKHKAILGADLEVSKSSNSGWVAILDSSTTIIKAGRASYFKIPHHGSENGYHERIWKELLEVNPNSNIAPWNRHTFLPTPKMLAHYQGLTNKLSLTSSTSVSKKPKKRDKDITKLITRFNHKLVEVKFSEGIVRNRIRQSESNWTIDTFGSAYTL